jgi:hypothetical protein
MSGSPSSIRFDPDVLRRLADYASAHPGTSLSSAGNRLVDEALRSNEHPLIVFRDGPAGRRARLVGGPDVWQVIRAVRSARAAEPDLDAEAIVALVGENSGVNVQLIRAAIGYWTAYPDEVDMLISRADREESEARERWRREHQLLGA